ncbi:MAG: YetF domain-containing protein, partial [Phormidesmis sp.]
LTLVGLHWLMASLSFRLPVIETWVKGRPRTIVQDGQMNHGALKTAGLTEQDLKMACRTAGSPTDLDQIALAVLEPNGCISVIPQSSKQPSEEPSSVQVVDISIEDNVQTVHILIHRE